MQLDCLNWNVYSKVQRLEGFPNVKVTFDCRENLNNGATSFWSRISNIFETSIRSYNKKYLVKSWYLSNVWVAKKDTKGNSVLLLRLVSFFATQTLGITEIQILMLNSRYYRNSNVSLKRVWPFSVWVLCWSRIRLHDLPFQDCRKKGGGGWIAPTIQVWQE